MQSPHYPQVSRRNDGRWVLTVRSASLIRATMPCRSGSAYPSNPSTSPCGSKRTPSGLPAGSDWSKPPAGRRAVDCSRRGAELAHRAGEMGQGGRWDSLAFRIRDTLALASTYTFSNGTLPDRSTDRNPTMGR